MKKLLATIITIVIMLSAIVPACAEAKVVPPIWINIGYGLNQVQAFDTDIVRLNYDPWAHFTIGGAFQECYGTMYSMSLDGTRSAEDVVLAEFPFRLYPNAVHVFQLKGLDMTGNEMEVIITLITSTVE